MADLDKLNKVRKDLFDKLTPAEKIWMGEPSEDTDIKTVPWHRIYYKDDGSGDAAAYARLLADGDELVFSFIVDKDHRRKKIGTMLLREAIDTLINKEKLKKNDIDLIISGDLQNQIATSDYAIREIDIPFLGIYNACATSAEGLIIASTFIDAKKANNCLSGRL